MPKLVLSLMAASLLGGSGLAAAELQGEYIEARTADVFTGPCFSNAEIFIYGKHAVMAWKVTGGRYQGVDLGGLCVAAAVQADSTFSVDHPEKARSVVIVDQSASPRQADALVALAKELGGPRLSHIAAVKSARMRFKLEAENHSLAETESAGHGHGMPGSPRASFWASGLAQIVTRPLDDGDHFCGNEVVAYQPLSKAVSAQPAYTLGHQFKGTDLDVRWDDPNCRSAFVGRFSL